MEFLLLIITNTRDEGIKVMPELMWLNKISSWIDSLNNGAYALLTISLVFGIPMLFGVVAGTLSANSKSKGE